MSFAAWSSPPSSRPARSWRWRTVGRMREPPPRRGSLSKEAVACGGFTSFWARVQGRNLRYKPPARRQDMIRVTRFGCALVAILLAIGTSSVVAQQPQTPTAGPAAAGQGPPGRGAAPAGGIPGGGRGAPVVIGPPAPVPAQVAIPRPTPAELEQTNAALKRLIDNDKSKDQALLKKFQSLMLLQPPR